MLNSKIQRSEARLASKDSPFVPILVRPRLLAPAGDWECARAAVENGADAIYFGLERFNARMRARNFTVSDLPALMTYLHRRGVRGYITFNILVFSEELPEAEAYLRSIIAAGVDAAIVQDVGICRLIRRLSPDFPIHASTQMTISSAAGLRFARRLDCELVALARECSIRDLAAMSHPAGSSADAHRTAPVEGRLPELEVFIHGALCVAYSGQCLTSESLGGRSANRGVCAQACRLPYELIADGQPVPLGDKRYLLSPQDLAGLEVLPDLIQAGVRTLKIEGRLKSPEYVANITRIYRQAIDRLCSALESSALSNATPRFSDESVPAPTVIPTPAPHAAHPAPRTPDRGRHPVRAPNCESAAVPELTRQLSEQSRYAMEMAFSRGLYTGWFRGVNNQALVHARFGKKRGVFLGEVRRVQGHRVLVALEGPLKPGDGVVFDAGRPDAPEEGGRVYTLEPDRYGVWLSFGRGDVNFSRLKPGDKLWKTDDPELDRRWRQSFAGNQPRCHRPIWIEVAGQAGQPLRAIARDEHGLQVEVASELPLQPAANQPLDTPRLSAQLGRLGDTPFYLANLANRLEGSVMLPLSALNRLRRALAQALEARRVSATAWTLAAAARPADEAMGAGVRPTASSFIQISTPAPGPCSDARSLAPAELVVLVRQPPQLDAALRQGPTTLYCEFENPKHYREAVQTVRQFARAQRRDISVWLAPPRIFKPGEEWILRQVQSAQPDGYLARNYDHLEFFAGARLIADFSLNIANPLSAEYFLQTYGLERVTAAYDLNAAQLETLLRAAPPDWFELTVHQHMPMFHMEHCVFCAFLSSGTDYTNCGRPCEKHELRLKDRVGATHPVKADAGCRNTVYNALAQTGAESVARFLALGARVFRLEFLDETPEQVARTIDRYQRLLRGEITGTQLWRELKLFNHLGVTRGPMDQPERGAPLPRTGD